MAQSSPVLESIFFEKQQGSLCAQHALNALLQGSYFTAVDLAELAKQLDTQEQDIQSKKGPSDNYDDSGYFSIQVLQKALDIWNIELVPFTSTHPTAIQARQESALGYICHSDAHWFTLRRFGTSKYVWYNLNSMLNQPEFISSTYLDLFLAQLQQEGCSVFVARHTLLPALPVCQGDEEADVYLVSPMDPRWYPTNESINTSDASLDQDLSKAIAMSLGKAPESDQDELEKAIAMSLGNAPESDQDLSKAIAMSLASQPSQDELEKALLMSMQEAEKNDKTLQDVLHKTALEYDALHDQIPRGSSSSSGGGQTVSTTQGVSLEQEDAALNKAIEESIQAALSPMKKRASDVSMDDMRQARLARFNPVDVKGKGKASAL